MSYISTIKSSCAEGDDVSSKRVVMFHFLYAAIFMIFVQAVFTTIRMYKWANLEGVGDFEVHSVFPDVVWYCVFSVIGGIAGINGVQKGFGKQKPKTNESVS